MPLLERETNEAAERGNTMGVVVKRFTMREIEAATGIKRSTLRARANAAGIKSPRIRNVSGYTYDEVIIMQRRRPMANDKLYDERRVKDLKQMLLNDGYGVAK